MVLIFCVILLVGLLIMALLSTQHANPFLNWLSYRFLTLAGAILVLAGFWYLPWLSFEPWGYLDISGTWILSAVPDALEFVGRVLGKETLAEVMGVVNQFLGLPGRLLIILMPTLDVGKLVWVRLVMALVFLAGAFSVLAFLLSLLPSPGLAKLVGGLQAFGSGLAFLVLLWETSNLDAWGTKGSFWGGFLPLFAGAVMDWGVWVTLAGLLYLVVGGLREIERGLDLSSERSPEQAPAASIAIPSEARRVLPLAGAGLVLIGFLALPWLRFGDWEENLRRLDQDTGLQVVVDEIPEVLAFLGCESASSGSECLVQGFEQAGLGWWLERAAQGRYMTGLGLALAPAPCATLLRVVLFMSPIAGLLALGWGLLSPKTMPGASTPLAIAGTAAALIVLVCLLGYVPGLDNLGARGEFTANLLLVVAQVRIGWGVWITALGLVLVALGVVAEAEWRRASKMDGIDVTW